MARTRVACRDVASFFSGKLSSHQTLCELLIHGSSIILSPFQFHFKVKVLNDHDGGLVRLFELYRCNREFVKELLNATLHQDREHLVDLNPPRVSSPFIQGHDDVLVAASALKSCIRSIFLEYDDVVARESHEEIIAKIHGYLESVLVERMDPGLFVRRFDRASTVFYIPGYIRSIIEKTNDFIDQLENVKGTILIERSKHDSSEFEAYMADFSITWGVDVVNELGTRILRSIDCLIPRARQG